jgi:chromosome partitioning protein
VLAPTNIVQRNDHKDAIAYGLGVTEHDPDGRAAEEIRLLWQWIKRKLEGKPHGETSAVA